MFPLQRCHSDPAIYQPITEGVKFYRTPDGYAVQLEPYTQPITVSKIASELIDVDKVAAHLDRNKSLFFVDGEILMRIHFIGDEVFEDAVLSDFSGEVETDLTPYLSACWGDGSEYDPEIYRQLSDNQVYFCTFEGNHVLMTSKERIDPIPKLSPTSFDHLQENEFTLFVDTPAGELKLVYKQSGQLYGPKSITDLGEVNFILAAKYVSLSP